MVPLGGAWSGGIRSSGRPDGACRMVPLGGMGSGPRRSGGIRWSGPPGGTRRMVPLGGIWSGRARPPGGVWSAGNRRSGPFGGPCRTAPLGGGWRTGPPGGPGRRISAGGIRGMGPVSGTRGAAPGGSCSTGAPLPRSQGAAGCRRRTGSPSAGSVWRGSWYSVIGTPALGRRARMRRSMTAHPATAGPCLWIVGSRWCLLSLQDPLARTQVPVEPAPLPRVQPLVGRIGLSPEPAPQAATGQQEQQHTGTCGNYRQC